MGQAVVVINRCLPTIDLEKMEHASKGKEHTSSKGKLLDEETKTSSPISAKSPAAFQTLQTNTLQIIT